MQSDGAQFIGIGLYVGFLAIYAVAFLVYLCVRQSRKRRLAEAAEVSRAVGLFNSQPATQDFRNFQVYQHWQNRRTPTVLSEIVVFQESDEEAPPPYVEPIQPSIPGQRPQPPPRATDPPPPYRKEPGECDNAEEAPEQVSSGG